MNILNVLPLLIIGGSVVMFGLSILEIRRANKATERMVSYMERVKHFQTNWFIED